MCNSRMLLLAAAVLLLVSGMAQAGVSHGYSAVFAIDTVTAVGDRLSDQPQATTLESIYPNPFNPRTTIAFELAETGPIELAIFDLRGRLVRVIEAGLRSTGRHQVTWDGMDNGGRAVPAGTYFCRLNATQGSQIRNLTLVR